MRLSTTVGILLIIFGALTLAYDGYTYSAHPQEITKHQNEAEPPLFSPIFGLVILTGGAILVIFGRNKKRK